MQMGIDGNHGIKQFGQPPTYDLLTDDLTRMKSDILPHIAEVRRHQRQTTSATSPQRPTNHQQLDELVIGPVQAPIEHYMGCHPIRQRQLAFAIGEMMDSNLCIRQPRTLGYPAGDRP